MKYRDEIIQQMQSIHSSGRFESHRKDYFSRFGFLMHKDAVHYLIQCFKNEPILKIIDIGCAYGNDYEIFDALINIENYKGGIDYYGCDTTPELIQIAKENGISAFVGSFQDQEIKTNLGQAHLVWANLSIIHFLPIELSDAIKDLCSYCLPNGILSIGIKVGNDFFYTDPADDKVPFERPTTLFNISTIKYELMKNNFAWISIVEKQKPDLKNDIYHYAWILAQRGI